MISLKSLLVEELNKISVQAAIDRKMFGPVYHGTSAEARDKIAMNGFRIPIGYERSGDVSHGYEASNYSGGIPAPIHHLGFGVYFTTVKEIAKKIAGGTARGMVSYFLNTPKLEVINFGSPNTMMKWWIKNGYDYKITPQTTFGTPDTNLRMIREERLRATIHMTDTLKSRWDAVWFKGKGLYRLLDGDQVCVYDVNNIYAIDAALIKQGDVGSKVIAKVGIDPYGRGTVVPAGTVGIITRKERPTEQQQQSWAKGSEYIYRVKFKIGGEQYNLTDEFIAPAPTKRAHSTPT